MKIVIHSFTFWPNIGGVESVSHALATGWVRAGHDVVVITGTPSDEERDCGYRVLRNPSHRQAGEVIRLSDVVFSNGASMRYFSQAKRCGKPFIWKHATYQLVSVDGMGWWKGKPAPLDPWESVRHHVKEAGWQATFKGATKLFLRRMIAHLVDANVYISRHEKDRQPLPRGLVIYNPFDLELFRVDSPEEALRQLATADSTFTFIGRLISEKGLHELVRAFSFVSQFHKQKTGMRSLTMKIIGDGPEKNNLQLLAMKLGISHQIKWVGEKSGEDLAREVRSAGICVLPSSWEEPMGVVVLELLAAGKPLIVSRRGGLAECAGDACLTFPNGDVAALAMAMKTLHNDVELQQTLVRNGLKRVIDFDPQASCQAYLKLFENILADQARGRTAGKTLVGPHSQRVL